MAILNSEVIATQGHPEVTEDHPQCFHKLKTTISAKSCVKYFDPTKPTTLEVDSSMKGLGAAILQNGQPVAFAPKALNSAQSNYPNIDQEMLAVVFGINHFHTYLYGHPFQVITDHKPLEMIAKKPLLRALPRLQRMLQKIQGYDFTIEYRQGKTITIYLIHPSGKLKLSFDRTTKNISQ